MKKHKLSFIALSEIILIIFLILIPHGSYSESGKTILLKIGSKTAYVNFQPVTLDVAPIETKGRTLVPLRFIAEQFGARKIEYQADTEEIFIHLDDVPEIKDELSNLKTENEQLKKENESLKSRIKELENKTNPNPQIQLPSPPRNLSGFVSSNQVVLTWIAANSGTYSIAGYRIYRSETESNNFIVVATVSSEKMTYTDPQVVEGKSYSYYIKTFDSGSPSNESSESNRINIQISSSPSHETSYGDSMSNPVPFQQPYLTPEGIRITLTGFMRGSQAWDVLYNTFESNYPPEYGMQYVLVNITVENISSEYDSVFISDYYFELVNSLGKKYQTSTMPVTQPDKGLFKALKGNLLHNQSISGCLVYYLPIDEPNMFIKWDYSFGKNIKYYAINKFSKPPSSTPKDQWQHQYTYQNLNYPYNLKETYIKEDAMNIYFRHTFYNNSVRSYYSYTYFTRLDIDQNLNTGSVSNDGTPTGYDYAIGFYYKDNEEIVGYIAQWDSVEQEFIFKEYMNPQEYNFKGPGITFLIPKKLFGNNITFNYSMLINDSKTTYFYPYAGNLTYPKAI